MKSLKYHANLQFASLFKTIFDGPKNPDIPLSLIELGCARSVWLPYFAKEHGFRVTGIDYSSLGCEQARAILAREGTDGEVILGDIFQPPLHLLNSFDYIVSFGVVEHFVATEQCLRACGRFLKVRGQMLTVIPNMNGLVGLLQKWLGREVYDVHVPLDEKALRRAHEGAGLNVLRCEYFCFSHFGVLNLDRRRQSLVGLWLSRALVASSALIWLLERAGAKLPANKVTSPYIICVSEKQSPSEKFVE
ncbi:MAG TPA: class I SAM-dependent methyltransferase [Terriglobales bacterium]|nr:class I SAM-dependent methyltransferase [Terriglobales bacterium]